MSCKSGLGLRWAVLGEEHSMCKDLEAIHGMASYVQKWSKLHEICWLIHPEKGG